MSIRAHLIKKTEYVDLKIITPDGEKYKTQEVFNLWHDDKLVSLLSSEGYLSQLNMDGCGSLSMPVSFIKDELLTADIEEQAKLHLAAAVKYAEKNGNDWLDFNLY